MDTTFILLALFFCHFLADYTHLSTPWMLNAKRFGKPFFPIFCHALVHATLMEIFLETYCYYHFGTNPFTWTVTVLDKIFFFQLITHFIIDVWKGRMNGWFPSLQSPANKWHWIIFGLDQFFHAVVIILMVRYLEMSL